MEKEEAFVSDALPPPLSSSPREFLSWDLARYTA
jgi:hypothetical protein